MEKVRLILPDHELVAADMTVDGKPYVGVFDRGLATFAHRDVFGWYLSLIIDYERTVGDGMPDKDDTEAMQRFADTLSEGLAGDPAHPNALFLGRVTGDGYTQLMWYVNNPDAADEYLRRLIGSGSYPFDFDYEMTHDPEWSQADYWLRPLTTR